MHFEDCQNRRWTLRVTVGSLERCRERTGLNALDLLAPGTAAAKAAEDDPFVVARVAHALLADDGGVGVEEFMAALDGEAWERLTRAVADAILEFFPEKKRKPLQEALAMVRAAEGRMGEAAAARAREELAKLEKMTGEELLKIAGALPESSASTPAP